MTAETPKTMSLEGWSVGVRSDLVCRLIPSEDGPLHVDLEVFYLVMEDHDGYRYRSHWEIHGHLAKTVANAKAGELLDHGETKLEEWKWEAPAYGSEAYCKNYGF